jgi:(S)-ureidoglycine aminohydrolase
MRAPHQLLNSRTQVRPRFALLPIEGIPYSKLPAWPGTLVRVHAAPALGAQFVQYLLDVPQGGGTTQKQDGRVETFFYVLSGDFALHAGGKTANLTAGGFALIPPTNDYSVKATTAGSLIMLKKVFEPAPGIATPQLYVGNQADVTADIYNNDEGCRLQTLIPDQIEYDLAMNIFTFNPGRALPITETHIMEHGLYFLEGKGVYYLDDQWMEVEATDFIWMGPFVPQSFYATGPVPSRYIYYKNVNREIPL